MCISNMGSFFHPPPEYFHYIHEYSLRVDRDSIVFETRAPVRVWFHPGQEQLDGDNTWYVFSYADAADGFRAPYAGVELRFLRVEEWWGRYPHRE